MPRKQSLMFHTPRKRSRRSSGVSFGFVALVFVVIVLLIALGSLIQFLQTPTGLIFAIVIIGTLIVYFVLRKRKQGNQRRALIILQQQEAAWHFYQQQEAERQEQERIAQLYAQQEWERQERERQEQERIARMKSLGDILVLTPGEFEELTGKILGANGFHDVQIVGGSGDLGVDIFSCDQYGNKHAVQCKRYAPGHTVGSPAIQTFFGMMIHHQIQKGIFVTTSTFSRPAIDLATQRSIQLIDGNQLIGLLQGLQQSTP